ncbi:MAG: type I DNA topoisomerase [Ruminococcaceae bacterium]|nr:type I DNA topoisomerase [Oscillospiraceae bacterium]
MSKLVIVESPPKAKTIKKFLGPGYEVMASMGHVRDLPENRLSVDVKNDFAPRYAIIKGKEELVEKLKAAAKNAECVYLAADPDREGEAISWHLAYILGLDIKDTNRVTFNEITKSGLDKGIANPRNIDINLVNSQQCRRILDRIVGYRLSPFVSQKIRRGLSAGRVQSVALRMICDREDEIRAFVPQEYWSIDAKLTAPGSKKSFPAEFYGNADGKIELTDKAQTDAILAELEGKPFTVTTMKKGTRKKTPAPPFITSTLQQEASRKLGFRSSRTMKIAQELYEGIEIGDTGAVGLITYMRTDSLRIADEARAAGNDYITKRWGDKYLPDKPHKFKQRANAQDAHEAIRPTMPDLEPEQAKPYLSADQYKLYKLVWERFIASLMAHCVHDTTNAEITCGDYIFKASGYTVHFEGYTALYESALEDKSGEATGALPKLEKDMELKAKSIDGTQHFTQPPARYTEDTLTRSLEENGVGRPSTYLAIVTTVLNREYVVREGKALRPTELGEQINKLIKERFPKIINVKFTAQMEKNLDQIEQGDKDWIETLHEFHDNFEKTLAEAKKAMEGITMKLPEEETEFICEKCGKRMVIKMGRYGKFIACPGYPECKNIKKIVNEIDADCPECGKKVVVKKSHRGRVFYGCSGYPECNFMSWNEPTKEKCPQCGKILFVRKGKVPKLACTAEGCGYERVMEEKSDT